MQMMQTFPSLGKIRLGWFFASVRVIFTPRKDVQITVHGDIECMEALDATNVNGALEIAGVVPLRDGRLLRSSDELVTYFRSGNTRTITCVGVSQDQLDETRKLTLLIEVPFGTKLSMKELYGDVRVEKARGDVWIKNSCASSLHITPVQGDMKLKIAGSGPATLEGIQGTLDVTSEGSGDVYVAEGHVTLLHVKSAASGTVTVDAVASELVLKSQASGDFRLVHLAGPADIRLHGSGKAFIDGGTCSSLKHTCHGSGKLRFGAQLNGPVDVKIQASGDVTLSNMSNYATALTVRVSASGEFAFVGVAEEGNFKTSASGDIHVTRVLTNPKIRETASGKVRIGSVG